MLFFVSDLFVEQYVGGAELTSEAIIQDSLYPVTKINSNLLTTKLMEENKSSYWIFGNFSNVSRECLIYAVKNLNYTVIEYDYKFCALRSVEKHNTIETCNCEETLHGKLVSLFLYSSKNLWFMSEGQKKKHIEVFPFLNKTTTRVLSSVFSKTTLDLIQNFDVTEKNDNWIVLGSPSWVKGADQSESYALQNDLKYEKIFNLEYHEFLKKMSESKGVIYLPNGADTCPRFIIEAKLLGCELIMNDNVQHKDEEWFKDKETILKFLSERTDVFWTGTEESWNLDTPDAFQGEEAKINIVIPFYNVSSWIEKTIGSIERQRYQNYHCYLIDDLSTDDTSEVIKRRISDNDNFTLITNKEKKFALGNIVDTIENNYEPESIYILLDGDDWLPSVNVFSHLNRTYAEESCLVTYGSYVYHPNGRRGVEPSEYPKETIEANSYREDKWRASHLRSFKGKIWNKLDLDVLKDEDESYYATAYDQAVMLPLLEMSAERAIFIDKILYVYNRENPNNVDKVKQQKQFNTAKNIRLKAKHTRVDDEDLS